MATQHDIAGVNGQSTYEFTTNDLSFTKLTDLEVYIGKGKVESIEVTNAGAGYDNITFTGSAGAGNTTNSVPLVFSGGGGSAPTVRATVTNNQIDSKFWTDANGTEFTGSGGSNYTEAPNISISGLSGGTGGQLTAKIYAKKTSGTDYTISKINETTVRLVFTPALVTNDKILIKRVTNTSTAINTFAAGSSITAADLNKSLDQIRYKVEELPTVTSTALSNGDKSEITVSGNTWTIDNNAVTTAKIANDAVDGNKLANNIDIAGTLDVTGNAIFDNNVNIKGDSKTFTIEQADGTDKFTVASSTGNTTIAGTLGVTGVTTFSSNVTITDNDALYAGTHGDIAIYHDAIGGHSYIKGLGTGNLRFTSDADIYVQKNTGGTTLGVFKPGTTTVDLYAGGTKRFETTTNGVYVTGQVDLTTDINVNTNKFNVAGATGNTTIAGTLTTAAQKAVTIGGPLILGPGISSPLTITDAGNETITVTGSYHAVVSHDGNASDLDTILSNPTAVAGQFLILEAVGLSYVITVKEVGTGNIRLNGADVELGNNTDHRDTLTLIYDGTKWCQISSSNAN